MFYVTLFRIMEPGERSGYSDALRAGQSEDEIPVETRFSAPVQNGPAVHPATLTRVCADL